MKAEVLPHEQTLELIRRANMGDEAAMSELFLHNSPLVHSIAKKYLGRGMEYEDLYQTGCMGLIKAIRNYNEEFGVRFSTYAVPMIAGEIKRCLRDEGIIHISRSLKELGARVVATREQLSNKLGRDVTVDELALELNCSAMDIVEALEAMRPLASIYEPVYEDSESQATIADCITNGKNEQEELINSLVLKEALSRLESKDRQIIVMRYFNSMTQTQIAKKLGISQVQVSRMEAKIIKSLRAFLTLPS